MRLRDKVALITGAGSGIGRQTALLFAREGARVVAVDIDEGAAAQSVDQIAAQGGEAVGVKADVSLAADCENMVGCAESTYGRLDVLFNNAGISHIDDGDAMDTDEETATDDEGTLEKFGESLRKRHMPEELQPQSTEQRKL